MEKKCESCGTEVQWNLIDEYDKKIKYKLCSNCLLALVNCRLSTIEFFSLLKNGHTTNEFYLHCDFYDEDTGEALQPNR